MRRWPALPLLLVLAGSAVAAELPTAKPEAVGLSTPALQKLTAALRADAEAGRIPGAVVLVSRHGKVAWHEAVGRLAPGSEAPMRTDSIFRIYSMTKPMVSAAALMQVERGRLALDYPIAKYLPAFAEMRVEDGERDVPAERQIAVRDLLRHTAGLTYGFFGEGRARALYKESKTLDPGQTNAELAAKLASLPLEHQPGTAWEYSQATDLLAHLVEAVSGERLDAFLARELFAPLGMTDTGFSVPAAQHGRIAEATVPLANVREPQAWLSGGGGTVSTAADYWRFCQAILNGGELDGARILKPESVAAMGTNQLRGIAPGKYYLPGAGYGFGLGFAVRLADEGAAYPGSKGDIWWGSYAGTYFWIDPARELIAILMIQAPDQRRHYRPLFRAMVYAALTD